jgi:hypothetical protein
MPRRNPVPAVSTTVNKNTDMSMPISFTLGIVLPARSKRIQLLADVWSRHISASSDESELILRV